LTLAHADPGVGRSPLSCASGWPQNIQFGVGRLGRLSDRVVEHNGSSRSEARARLVTLGERLLGSFPVQGKIQSDPAIRVLMLMDRNGARYPP